LPAISWHLDGTFGDADAAAIAAAISAINRSAAA
jgi:hypothetical protein